MKRSINLFKVAALSIFLLLINTAQADAATASLSPSSATVAQGSVLTISIRENSGSEPINAAAITLSYPADKFDFVSIGNSSAFGIVAANSGGGGTVKVDRGALPAVTGSQTIATVRLRAKVSSGTANIEITSGSLISANSNTNVYTGGSGGRYTLTAVTATPAVPEVPKDTIPPTIKDLKVTEIGINSAIITWTTSEPATAEVNYGLSKSYGLSASDPTPKTEHKITLNSPLITPSTVFHYAVKSVDPAGNAVTSENSTFSTKGLSVVVNVKDQNGKNVKGAVVSIGDKNAKTDNKGQAQILGLGLGDFSGVVKYKGDSYTFTGSLTPADISDKPKTISVNIKTNPNFLIFALPALLLMAIAILIIYPPWRQKLIQYLPQRFRNSKLLTKSAAQTLSQAQSEPKPPQIFPPTKRN